MTRLSRPLTAAERAAMAPGPLRRTRYASPAEAAAVFAAALDRVRVTPKPKRRGLDWGEPRGIEARPDGRRAVLV